jgi:nitrite reductase/ring-hydroxylating ferredoxin subunit
VDDIPVGKLRQVEIDGEEIVIANINGKFSALCDRLSYSFASLF